MKKYYYIVSLKHTSKGDACLTFWGANGSGYTWDYRRAGLYTWEELQGSISDENVAVEQEKVDPFWMNALDYNDKYISVPNNQTVLRALKLNDKLMKPKKYKAGGKLTFLNTPVDLTEAKSVSAN